MPADRACMFHASGPPKPLAPNTPEPTGSGGREEVIVWMRAG